MQDTRLNGRGPVSKPHLATKIRKRGEIEMRPRGLGRALGREAGQPVGDIGRIADLAGLAVADDVDAAIDLPLDRVGDGAAHDPIELGRIDRGALLAPLQQRDHRVAARQAAHMGGENAIPTGFQLILLDHAIVLRLATPMAAQRFLAQLRPTAGR